MKLAQLIEKLKGLSEDYEVEVALIRVNFKDGFTSLTLVTDAREAMRVASTMHTEKTCQKPLA